MKISAGPVGAACIVILEPETQAEQLQVVNIRLRLEGYGCNVPNQQQMPGQNQISVAFVVPIDQGKKPSGTKASQKTRGSKRGK